MVKLKLTAWAEEQIKQRMDTFTLDDYLMDPEVKAAYETGFIDFGEGSRIARSNNRKQNEEQILVFIEKGGLLRSYARKTWQVYNPPKRKKQ